jgi:hypothetical protein
VLLQLMHTVASGGIGAVILSADGKVLAGAADGTLCLLDLPNGSNVSAPPIATVPGPISSVTVADRGTQLLVGTQHGDIFR